MAGRIPHERLDQLALAVALDAGDADDLAGAHLQVEAGDGAVAAVVVDLEAGDVEHDVARVGGALLDLQHDAAPDHHVGQAGAVGRPPAWSCRRPCRRAAR